MHGNACVAHIQYCTWILQLRICSCMVRKETSKLMDTNTTGQLCAFDLTLEPHCLKGAYTIPSIHVPIMHISLNMSAHKSVKNITVEMSAGTVYNQADQTWRGLALPLFMHMSEHICERNCLAHRCCATLTLSKGVQHRQRASCLTGHACLHAY